MNHRIFDDWLGYICGVFGGGLAWIHVNWAEFAPRFAVSMASACLAGLMGYLGKTAGAWMVRRNKSFFNSFKSKK